MTHTITKHFLKQSVVFFVYRLYNYVSAYIFLYKEVNFYDRINKLYIQNK